MNNGVNNSQSRQPLARVAAAAGFLFFAAGPVFAAGPHSARVSADLADHLHALGEQLDEGCHFGLEQQFELAAIYRSPQTLLDAEFQCRSLE